MRILQMVPSLESGGVETGTVDISRALKKKGHDVYVMSSGGELVKELVKAGVQHVTYPIHSKSLASLFLVRAVADFIRRHGIDIVHARSRVPAWIGYLATRRLDASFITTCHGYYSNHWLSRVMGWGKEVIVISRVVGRHMIDDFEVSSERIHLIHRGVDLSRYRYDPNKYDRPGSKNRFVIANIGRISPIKGHQHFIKAVHLARQYAPSLEGWIVGSPDRGRESYLIELEGLVRKLGLEQKIRFLGTRRDIPEILAQADLLALTTNVPEAFGRVLIEAGASGTAVVSTQVGGVVEIVEHNRSGLLVPVNDVEMLAKSFVDLAGHPEKCAGLAHALRQKVEENFSLDRMVDKTLDVYEMARSQRRILVMKLGSLGDLILAVPSLRMLRKKFPRAAVSLIVDSRWYGVMNGCPYLDEIWAYDRARKKARWPRLLKLAKRLRERRFDLSVDLQNNFKSHLLAFLAGIPKRLGYGRGWSSRLLTHSVARSGDLLSPVEQQFRVLNLAGVSDLEDHLEFWLKEEDKQAAESLLEEAWVNPTQKVIGFSLAASARWPTKNWPVDHFVQLASELGAKMNSRIFLLGDAHALPLAEAFEKQGFPFVTNLVNKTSLPLLMALIGRLDVLVTGDSAPMHIAAALGTKFVALFGPTEPARHLPPGKNFAVLKKELPCSPCYEGRCRAREFLCMPMIRPDEVFRAVVQMLEVEKEVSAP